MFLINKGGVLVVDVRPGTPAAEAGIAKGDAIESIDGEPAEKLTLGGVREAFRRPSGTQLELQIRSKGASSSHKVLLTLRDYV
jgi:C-terminal processing protease CtpA/Prc